MTQYKVTYNLQMQCCPGYGPKPNCLRKLTHIVKSSCKHIIIIVFYQHSNLQSSMWH